MQIDQAETLRCIAKEKNNLSVVHDTVWRKPNIGHTKVIAIASGKGGVGKTSLVVNLSLALAKEGHRVLALDGDLGLANLDIAFGVTSEKTILDVVQGLSSIHEVIVDVAPNVSILPACSGRFELANLTESQQYSLFTSIDTLESHFDVLCIDTAAGIGANAISFTGAADYVVVVLTPDPTSFADAYAFIKVVTNRCGVKRVHLVANMVKSSAEGEKMYGRMASLVERFLGVGVIYLGCVMHDTWLLRSVRLSQPLLQMAPFSQASENIIAIAKKMMDSPASDSGSIRLFWQRLMHGSAV